MDAADSANNGVDSESNRVDSLEVLSSTLQEVKSVMEILSGLELNLVCFTDKLVNLDILMMHVATRESDFEVFASKEGPTPRHVIEKAIEFDLLSGVLDSEVRDMECLLSSVGTEIENLWKIVCSCGPQVDEAFVLIEEKLHDREESLKQLEDHLLDLKTQCTNFHGIILTASKGDQTWQDGEAVKHLNGEALLTPKTKIKMQTVEQQRHILRMLEKSLAKEMDLEKKLTESRQVEKELNVRLQQEAFCMEEEIETCRRKLFEGENAAEVFSGISKSLLGRLQLAQLKENQLESKVKVLEEDKVKLNEELNLMKNSSSVTSERINILEKQLRESELKLQSAVAVGEACQEKQNMLNSIISDMENLIGDLKTKVLRAESLMESAEEKCIILSEAISDLNEELASVRGKLCQAEETKKATAREINFRSKLIADLVLQLALERERLKKQISLLIMENRVQKKLFQQKDLIVHDTKGGSDLRAVTSPNEIKEEKAKSSLLTNVEENIADDVLKSESKEEISGSSTRLDLSRDIDARQLNYKLLLVVFVCFFFIYAIVVPLVQKPE